MAVKRYNGSNWDTVAGVGAQGATGPAGASATTIVTTKGDLLGFSTTAARLGVGANNTVLTADSAEATGLKWATASGKTWQQKATGSMTGSSITVSSLTGQEILVSWENWSSSSSAELKYRLNSNSGSNYLVQSSDTPQTEAWAFGAIGAGVSSWSFAYIPAADSTAQVKTSSSNLYPWSIKEPNAVTSITFFPSAGSFDAGTYYVWELK
jgi:hypothetical protein